jgi:hypothetical protein
LAVIGIVLAAAQVGIQTLTAAPAAASVNTTVVMADSAFDSEPVKSATARCPAGKRVLGGGGQLFHDNGRVVLATMIPLHSSTFDGYTVTAVERPGGHRLNWTVRVYAVCANPLPGIEIVMAFTTDDIVKNVRATCPAGKAVVGTGAAVGSPELGTSISSVWPEGHVRESVYVAAHGNQSRDLPEDFAVFAWAVCAYHPPGYQIIRESVHIDDRTEMLAIARCPDGQQVLAAGGSWSNVLSGGRYTTSHLEDMFASNHDLAWTRARLTGVPDNFALLTTAVICAD